MAASESESLQPFFPVMTPLLIRVVASAGSMASFPHQISVPTHCSCLPPLSPLSARPFDQNHNHFHFVVHSTTTPFPQPNPTLLNQRSPVPFDSTSSGLFLFCRPYRDTFFPNYYFLLRNQSPWRVSWPLLLRRPSLAPSAISGVYELLPAPRRHPFQINLSQVQHC